ncbi:MAG: aminotransferase class I/II-fold pyridoxal phosphate-dependent enzyme [Cytophagales bacterium]|nr:aminotransferase class I/II-fold pyridoxal phosphate-dependent enzyme [Cytophagales bacterium]
MTSKLPNTGTSIFTTMSQRAAKHGALNMAQGFPDFDVSQELIDRVALHMNEGRNQYPPSAGIPDFRQAIAEMHSHHFGTSHDPETEITVTSGATEALFSTITALIHEGEEVIVFDPAYDSYEPVIELQKAKTVHLKLSDHDFTIGWQEVVSAITDKTRAIIINTPHNPTGAVMTDADMLALDKIATEHDLIVISDEVYHHIVFDGAKHRSVLQYPELAKRSVAIFSFGKTFHATGWKVGYVAAPKEITAEIRKIHQFVTFTTHTPCQFAIADFVRNPSNYEYLPDFFQKKRDIFLDGVKGSRFEGSPASGTYFQLLRFDNISKESDTEMANRLTREFQLASIPISNFFADGHDASYLRFCFAKEDNTLEKAAEILQKI